MSIIDEITKEFTNKKVPPFKSGDTVRVFIKIKEGEKERVQYFEGVVIAIHRNGVSTTFKVRKESYGVGVERTFPLYSPLIQKIEVKKRGDVRRAKLYYLRKLSGKKARIKEKKDWMIKKKEVLEEDVPPPAEEAVAEEVTEAEAPAPVTADTPEVVEDLEGDQAQGETEEAAESPPVQEEVPEVEGEIEEKSPDTEGKKS